MPTAMILAAGLGTRLRPLTIAMPKPLLPVGDRPAMLHAADVLVRSGFDRLVVNTHHAPDAFDGVAFPVRTELSHEPDILGTAGGLARVRDRFDGDALVWNGDIVADVDVAALGSAMESRPLAAWLCAPRAAGEGTVGVDAAGCVCRVRGWRRGDEVRGGDFLGIQIVSGRALGDLPPRGCLVGDVAIPALERGERIVAVMHERPWDDIGTLADYLAANLRWLGARETWIGDGAVVTAPLSRVVVGRGARVEGGSVARVVVLPGAVARGPLEDAVVTRDLVVPVG